MTTIQKFFSIVFTIALASFTLGTTTVFASNLEEQATPAVIQLTSPFSVTDRNGDTYFFVSAQDKLAFEQLQYQRELRYYNLIQPRERFVRNISIGRKFVGYNPLTPYWSKASSYNLTLTNTITVNSSFNYNGVTYGISGSLGRGVSIDTPANPNRNSRLAIEVDVQLREYRIDYVDTSRGNQVVRSITTYRPIVIETYNVVAYQ
ncbi:hypothetical protein [Streptococcus sp. E17BB]|uniref:hypothetical protein n=1 Tax=Streptococcus sp. E17BB TaxID=3278714 RepID=UPI00359CFAA2